MVVDTEHSTLDQTKEAFNCVGCDVPPVLVSGILFLFVRHNVVIGIIIMQEVIDRRFVGLNSGADFNVRFHNGLDVVERNAVNVKGAYLTATFSALHQGNNGALLLYAVTGSASDTLFLRPYPCLINLDQALELLKVSMLSHGETKPMQHEPDRLVANSGHAVNLMCGHSFLTGAKQIRRKQPAMKRDVAVFEYGSDRDSELFAASTGIATILCVQVSLTQDGALSSSHC